MIRYSTELISHWPKLSWVATCSATEGVHIRHGDSVEVHDDWFGELTWDGDFEANDFDRAEHVFGSGGRLRGNAITFVSASSVLDRLQWTQRGDTTWISNSFSALLAVSGLRLCRSRTDYPSMFKTICCGLNRYQRRIPVDNGSVYLVYMKNLVWCERGLVEKEKPSTCRKVNSFGEYRDRITCVMEQLGMNWSHRSRRLSYDAISTISTGYDSPTATVLGRIAGLRDTLSIVSGRSGAADDGSQISTALGLNPHAIGRDDWRKEPLVEVPFIASDAKGEDVYIAGARRLLGQRVLLTGYGGTRVWSVKRDLQLDHKRGDQSGLSHTEARLHYGYLHVPVPFVAACHPRDLREISASVEMRPWHVEGDYNCPIARRIVEEAGVDRELFGMEKKAASILLFDRDSFLSQQSLIDFLDWYREHHRGIRCVANACRHLAQRAPCRLADIGQQAALRLYEFLPFGVLNKVGRSSRLKEYADYQPLFGSLFPWAIDRITQTYASPK